MENNAEFQNDTRELIDFIEKSPSCYHAVENVKQELLENGYTELDEGGEWEIENGGKYFVIRNLSSIIAFNIPQNKFSGFMICASHSDSPTFKIKPNPEMESSGCYIKLNVEKYGGMICSTWLDRPLSVAGRALVDTDGGIETRLINIDRDLCVIPNLAIHMDREINEGYAFNPQKDMLPLIGDINSKEGFLPLIAENAGIEVSDILGYDLFLYNRQKGTVWGMNKEYFSVGKIDDLQCAFSSLKALLSSKNENAVTVMAIFDNEEVGSGTKQGAKSTFLADTIERINESLGRTRSELIRAITSSMMLSADNGHAVHPNKPEKADPTNAPKPNGGIVIKYNANQKYTTDGVSEAILKKILIQNNIPYQEYVNRSDIAGGSTLGNLSNEKVSLNTADIGTAQLAMHSCYETGGIKDTSYLIDGIKAFYNSTIQSLSGGKFIIK